MAHFAKLDDNNMVVEVHVVNNDVITVDGVESEQAGIDFLTGLFGHTNWKQTSYSGSIRKRYCGVGYSYDPSLDMFIQPKPYKSWTLDSNGDWQAPVSYPTDGNRYDWDENSQSWIEHI
jgi:hypothetical protein